MESALKKEVTAMHTSPHELHEPQVPPTVLSFVPFLGGTPPRSALLERRELGPCPLEPPMLLPRMAPAQTPTPDPTPPPRPAPASSVTSRGVLSTGPLLSQPTASKPHFTEATAGGIVADY